MFLKGVNGWAFPEGTSWADAARQAKEAGFEALEPTLEGQGELTPESTETECHRIGDAIRCAGLKISSLATGLFWEKHYTAADPVVREQARELTRAALLRARWLGAPVLLVVPGMVCHPRNPSKPIARYEEATRLAYESLRELCHDAEQCGVVIALENVWNRFLISPVEMRDFVDRINSPWVGVYLDVGNALRYGFPQDWLDTLGWRVAGVHLKDFKLDAGNKSGFCALGEGDVDWPAVIEALRRQRYDGPLICEGRGQLDDLAVRLDRILTDAQ
jgi:L-ribulose-5-phosphate 3-epimerase